MNNSFRITLPKSKPRNGLALVATLRTGSGPHKKSCGPRGGARNDQMEMLLEWELEQDDQLEVLSSHEAD